MPQLAQAVVRDLLGELAEDFEAAGGEMVADIRQDISTPVQYVRGKRGGAIIIRSKPGEPPRYETGSLWRNVQMEVEIDRTTRTVTLEVFCTISYSVYLETGTDNMAPRPFWSTAWLRWRDRITSFLRIN